MFYGTKASLTLNSTPSGASVKLQSLKSQEELTAQTPTVVKVKRKNQYQATFDKQGYQPQTLYVMRRVKKEARMMDALWIFVGYAPFFVFMSVDVATGGWAGPDPPALNVTLYPIPGKSGHKEKSGEGLPLPPAKPPRL
jgi:hypothetical protein